MKSPTMTVVPVTKDHAQCLRDAAKQFRKLHGVDPNLCYGNPHTIKLPGAIAGMALRASNQVHPNTYCLLHIETKSIR